MESRRLGGALTGAAAVTAALQPPADRPRISQSPAVGSRVPRDRVSRHPSAPCAQTKFPAPNCLMPNRPCRGSFRRACPPDLPPQPTSRQRVTHASRPRPATVSSVSPSVPYSPLDTKSYTTIRCRQPNLTLPVPTSAVSTFPPTAPSAPPPTPCSRPFI